MKGCLRPWRKATNSIVWLEERLLKFWTQKTPPEISKVGEFWGYGQIQILHDGEEWRGRVEKCELERTSDGEIRILNNAVVVKVTLYWFAHKDVSSCPDEFGITRSTWKWDRIVHPYKLELILQKVQQTKVKPKRLYFEASNGEKRYFSCRTDEENVLFECDRIIDPCQE